MRVNLTDEQAEAVALEWLDTQHHDALDFIFANHIDLCDWDAEWEQVKLSLKEHNKQRSL